MKPQLTAVAVASVAFFALRKTCRRAQRQATEFFVCPKTFTSQSDRCAVSAKSQRDLAHQSNRHE
jgi:hypothetical protein